MQNISQVLHAAYVETPDLPVLHLLHSGQPDHAVSYRDLLDHAAGYADLLTTAGVQPQEVVILILEHGLDLVGAFFGAVLCGAIPSILPFQTEKLDPEKYQASLEALFEITHPAAVLTNAKFCKDVQQAASRSNFSGTILQSERVQANKNNGLTHTKNLPGINAVPENIVLLQHSSGTTGLQKGVALSHRAVFNQLESYARAILLNSDDVIVSWLPLYHDMGLIAGFLLPLLTRTPLVLMSPFDWVRAPYRLLQAVSTYRGTLSWLPNFAFNFCAQKIRARDLDGVDVSSWRAVINCSEPMYWSSHRMFVERFKPYGLRAEALATCYAMAENVFAVTQGGISAPVTVDWVNRQALVSGQVARPHTDTGQAVPMLSAGHLLDNCRVKIIAPTGQPLPERQIGEIALQSDCMLTGYYNRPDLTSQAFSDGWYLTGDLGYLAGEELFITGRKKDLIIVGGKNVYPQDIERLVNEAPGVYPGRVVAFGVYNERSGTEDVIVLAESETNDPDERAAIAAEIRRRVTGGSEIALRYVQVVDRHWLLKTSSGKIARSANRNRYMTEFNHPSS